MRILFICWAGSGNPTASTLTTDLSDEFHRQGHQVTVIMPLERKYNQDTHLVIKDINYEILYVRTGNFFNLNSKLEKVITIFTITRELLKGIMHHYGNRQFDLIITRAPFLGEPKLIVPLKRHFKCPAYLLLFDIFPQTAWDMNIIRHKIVYDFFKYKEKKMLSQFEAIWCTSPGNARYMLSQHKELTSGQIQWIYNFGQIKPAPIIDKLKIRESMGYSDKDFIALFGGNMGIPQKLENLLYLADKAKALEHAKFLFVGIGTEKKRIELMAKDMNLLNIKFIDYLPREEYERITASCDIGLVSLNERFTVPNFPSKTTDYYKLSLPILASLDNSAAEDYGRIIQDEIRGGLYAPAGDISALFAQFETMYNNPSLCYEMGKNGRKFYEQELDVCKTCKKIVDKYYMREKNEE